MSYSSLLSRLRHNELIELHQVDITSCLKYGEEMKCKMEEEDDDDDEKMIGIGGEDAWSSLLRSLSINESLLSLQLRDIHLQDPTGIQSLIMAIRHHPLLEKLVLGYNQMGDRGLMALSSLYPDDIKSESKSSSNITTLALGRNGITQRGISDFMDVLKRAPITRLDLSENLVGDQGMQALSVVLRQHPTLKHLNLWKMAFKQIGAESLAYALESNTTLRSLNLLLNMTGAGITSLCHSLINNPHTSLCDLNIGANDIGSYPQAVRAVADLIAKNTSITRIDLSANAINEDGMNAIARSLASNRTLTQLNLSWNTLTSSSTSLLARSLTTHPSITSLSLSNCRLGDKHGVLLAKMLSKNHVLNYLGMAINQIGDKGGVALAQSLQRNRTLQEMNLRQNSLSDKSSTAIAHALHFNNTITTLHLSQNRLTQIGIDVLNEMLEKNMTVKYLGKFFYSFMSVNDPAISASSPATRPIALSRAMSEESTGEQKIAEAKEQAMAPVLKGCVDVGTHGRDDTHWFNKQNSRHQSLLRQLTDPSMRIFPGAIQSGMIQKDGEGDNRNATESSCRLMLQYLLRNTQLHETNKKMAFAMGFHPRLGASSSVYHGLATSPILDINAIREIYDYAFDS